MNQINHAIVTRASFTDKARRDKYYKISKEVLIPAIKSQTEQNFVWVLIMHEEDVDYTKNYFDIDFVPIFSVKEYIEYASKNKLVIQTRHDIDDWMSPQYIEELQNIYKKNIQNYEKFIIHAQPVKYMYHTKKETIMRQYTSTCTSMFVSLCQRDCTNHILERKHAYLCEIVPTVFKIKEGYVKWNIHGDNISCIGR